MTRRLQCDRCEALAANDDTILRWSRLRVTMAETGNLVVHDLCPSCTLAALAQHVPGAALSLRPAVAAANLLDRAPTFVWVIFGRLGTGALTPVRAFPDDRLGRSEATRAPGLEGPLRYVLAPIEGAQEPEVVDDAPDDDDEDTSP